MNLIAAGLLVFLRCLRHFSVFFRLNQKTIKEKIIGLSILRFFTNLYLYSSLFYFPFYPSRKNHATFLPFQFLSFSSSFQVQYFNQLVLMMYITPHRMPIIIEHVCVYLFSFIKVFKLLLIFI